MKQYVCDFCGNVVENPSGFIMQYPVSGYIHSDVSDMCSKCEDIVVPASAIFIREVKKQCQKAEKAEPGSKDF